MNRVVVWMTVCCVTVYTVCLLSAATRGHALWKTPTLRPFSYVPNPDTNNPSQAAFPTSAAAPFPFGRPPSPSGSTSIRAGAGVGRTYGNYYIDPMLWVDNANHPTNVTYLGSIYKPTWLWYDTDTVSWVIAPPAGAWIPRDPAVGVQLINGTPYTNWISTRSVRAWLRSGSGFWTPY